MINFVWVWIANVSHFSGEVSFSAGQTFNWSSVIERVGLILTGVILFSLLIFIVILALRVTSCLFRLICGATRSLRSLGLCASLSHSWSLRSLAFCASRSRKFFFKKCVSIDSKWSKTHRNAKKFFFYPFDSLRTRFTRNAASGKAQSYLFLPCLFALCAHILIPCLYAKGGQDK